MALKRRIDQLAHQQRHHRAAGNGHAHQAAQFVGAFGLFFDRDREEHRPDIGEAQAGGKNARHSNSGFDPVISAPRTDQSQQRRQAETRRAALMTVRMAPPSRRPIVSSRKNKRGPKLAGRLFRHAHVLKPGKKERAHAGLRADIKKDAEHRQEENGLPSKPRLDPMLGGTSALVS